VVPDLAWQQPDAVIDAADDDAGTVALDPAFVVPRRLAIWAATDPDRSFLVETTGRALTYAATWDAVRRWMTWLDELGVRPGDRVVTMLPSSIDSIVAWLAVGSLGALEVPVNPELRGGFLSHIIDDSAAKVAVVRPEFAPMLADSGLHVIALDRSDEQPLACPPYPLDALPASHDPSCVIYTSGTTGPAKGVVLSWAQIASTIGRIPRNSLSEADAVFAFNPMFHVTGRSPVLSMIDVGGRLVLRERFSASTFFDDVRRFGCTSATVQVGLVLATPERDDDRDNPLRVIFGSHNPTLTRRFADRFDVHVIDAYGSTEAGFPIIRRWAASATERSCGRLRRGYAARIVDPSGVDVPDGSVGELWVHPPARPLVMLSYLNRPDATASAIVDGWYRTGDAMIRQPDGTFEYVDRLSDTIRRMGENISASQIEAVVAADAEVGSCAALAVPDPLAGHEVLLATTPAEGASIDPAALFERLSVELPRFMLPAYIVVVDELPMTPTGKVQKTHLLAALDVEGAWRPPARQR
jgi:crotonobetaine/carnitine-CoA ligase